MGFAEPKKTICFRAKLINASIKLPRLRSCYYRFLLMALPIQKFGNFSTLQTQNNQMNFFFEIYLKNAQIYTDIWPQNAVLT